MSAGNRSFGCNGFGRGSDGGRSSGTTNVLDTEQVLPVVGIGASWSAVPIPSRWRCEQVRASEEQAPELETGRTAGGAPTGTTPHTGIGGTRPRDATSQSFATEVEGRSSTAGSRERSRTAWEQPGWATHWQWRPAAADVDDRILSRFRRGEKAPAPEHALLPCSRARDWTAGRDRESAAPHLQATAPSEGG
jgi:hypothetical protein